MRLVTYNVHGWVGRDGSKNPERVLGVLRDLSPDCAALQEVVLDAVPGGADAKAFIEDSTGMYAFFGQTMLREDSGYGNVFLSKRKPLKVSTHNISCSLKGCEPRGLIIAEMECSGRVLTIFATHFGLKNRERLQQAEEIAAIASRTREPMALMCDCNEWRKGRASRVLDEAFNGCCRIRSFPARFPLFALDSIRVKGVEAEHFISREGGAKTASDHLPLCAELSI
ncbi:endonuclease/exonuclease/phosphatase family protein [Limisalsivibrio acetivorans]|uniref:endonuclease/exonuclease/phosphatase family protein n=1 Tax=Limisalsivibrio acetivorans TaxID=1304888 RepID=UPI0003B6A37A|nr:endonuclease [Limisalsivibrio acetivorans]